MVGNCASVQVSCARRMRTWAVVPEAANSLLRSTVAVPFATERPSRSADAGTCEPTPASDSDRFGPASSACTAARAGRGRQRLLALHQPQLAAALEPDLVDAGLGGRGVGGAGRHGDGCGHHGQQGAESHSKSFRRGWRPDCMRSPSAVSHEPCRTCHEPPPAARRARETRCRGLPVPFAAMQVTVLNGVNLNMLGRRDPEQYGDMTLQQLETRIYEWAQELNMSARCSQTNQRGRVRGHDPRGLLGHRRARREPRRMEPLQLRHPRCARDLPGPDRRGAPLRHRAAASSGGATR